MTTAATDAAATGEDRRRRLAGARLYLVCDARPGGRPLADVLPAAIAGGVDVFQLREKELSESELLPIAREAVEICQSHGALAIVNDWPQVALACQADGIHVGQEDMAPARVRGICGPQMLVGLSTHAPGEIDAAGEQPVDYIGVGPVHETPTKLGRPAVGTELVEYAAANARFPFFAIGGIDTGNIGTVLAAGAGRVCVLRAIAVAEDPADAARRLRAQIDAVPLR
ncbi:MAG: thiamine phosphate synthase [Solirubrobacteraceae bacterium]